MSTFCNYWNKVSLVKSKIKKSKKIDSIGIGLASPEEIRRWGERRLPNGTLIGKVDKDHTVDYESLKPIEGGLFCERIFGPVEDFYCSCDRKGEKNEKFCPTCQVEFTKSRVRRIRMGYIPLAVPVAHVWYLRGRPSYIANLVGKSRNSIDRLAYGETLSESFIGYSSLESIYKKEENVFSKRPHDAVKFNLKSNSDAKDFITEDTNQRKFLQNELQRNDSFSCNSMRNDSFSCNSTRSSEGAIIGAARERIISFVSAKVNSIPFFQTPSFAIPTGYKATNLQFVTAEKSVAEGSETPTGVGYSKGILFGHKQKYLKCHTLPLFSTFVYKEWAHRFSFLEYFIWSARNNDLILPFYAYQNSKSEKRLANICESIRKSSINLVRNKFSLRFSNKSNCNQLRFLSPFGAPRAITTPYPVKGTGTPIGVANATSYPIKGTGTPIGVASAKQLLRSSIPSAARSKKAPSGYKGKGVSLVNKNILQEQKVQLNFLQLRNKQGVLRVIKVKKDIDFLFHTKPNFYDIRFANNFVNNDELRRNSLPFTGLSANGVSKRSPLPLQALPLQALPLQALPLQGMGLQKAYASRRNSQLRVRRKPLAGYGTPYKSSICKKLSCVNELRDLVCYAFNTIQQDTESTPLNKMDTQQFPRLTELLNFTGGAALRNLLSRFDLIVLSKFLRHELKNLELKVNSLLALKILTYSQGLLLGKLAKRRSKQIRRLKLLELFQSQKSNPEWMILSVIPVLPPDLRPILRVNDDFVVASDLNRLYQTVLRRNNTIHERLDDPLPCPESGLFRQRSLQKAVDGLLENGKGGGTPLCASKRRPLVSLSHVLKGKKGLFRQHLLGKRVDYSGRSVIVVGPRLQVHECGLPKEMAIELFQPFLLHRLKVKGLATSNTTARRMIQQGNPVIWHLLKQLIYEHPVLLNRAPTLHRLGIQAFQPRLVSGRAILLHPLVCNGFNADFDGDQMAVHVPLSFQARAEAWKIMWSKNNFLSPATGQPILVPSQDMVLGCYYLSVSIPRILNANVSIVSHDKAMTDNTNLTNRRFVPFVPCLNAPKMQNKRFDISKLGISTANNFIPDPSFATLQLRTPSKGKGFSANAQLEGTGVHSKAFLNENKGQYFSNLQDSLLAYFQGRLQTHTPFWVRIDDKFAREKIIPFASNKGSFNDSANDSSMNFSRAVARKKIIPCANSFTLPGYSRKPFTVTGLSANAQLEGKRISGRPRAIAQVDSITQAKRQTNPINNRFCDTKASTTPSEVPFLKASKGTPQLRTPLQGMELLLPKVRELLAVSGRINKEKLNDLAKANPNFTNIRITSNHNVITNQRFVMNRPNINIDNLKALKLTFLQPLHGSSREICKTLFQNKNANNSQIRVEANETLESPLELRLSVDGNLANILTMFQNHYNYNATWVKQCKEESIKYMRTTAGRVVINDVLFKDF